MATDRTIINNRAVDAGRLAQRRGNAAEGWILGECKIYEREGTAFIGKLRHPLPLGAGEGAVLPRMGDFSDGMGNCEGWMNPHDGGCESCSRPTLLGDTVASRACNAPRGLRAVDGGRGRRHPGRTLRSTVRGRRQMAAAARRGGLLRAAAFAGSVRVSQVHLDRPYNVKGLMRVCLVRAEALEMAKGQMAKGPNQGVEFFAGGVVVVLLDERWGAPARGVHVVVASKRCVVMLDEVVRLLGGGGSPRPGMLTPRARRLCYVRVRIWRAGPEEVAAGGVTATVSPVGPIETFKVGRDKKEVQGYPWLSEGDDAWCDFSLAVPHRELVWTRRADLEEVGEGEMVGASVGGACDVMEGVGTA